MLYSPKRKVVFDIDDVLWGLTHRVVQQLSIKYQDWITFQVLQNERYSMETRIAINNAFRDPATFANMQFYTGVERIMDIEEYGAIVQIKSNSFSEAVAVSKRQQLLCAIPGLREEQLYLPIVDEHTTMQKRFDDDTFISIDDSPSNIAGSPACFNFMPYTPWGSHAGRKQARDTLSARGSEWLDRSDCSAFNRPAPLVDTITSTQPLSYIEGLFQTLFYDLELTNLRL